ncbi:MFS general substrate transporter [Glarea lozoyensis ATCC 20868]|uniref:MFS general substrate transporter n=1 Tax=Glarea lozoyensis (strain ATCC 20868 / MF5171) TaxID=1116229 RepID=S3D2F2_GLAL2|nr:MFS general substrate transporter [Glarea lozoyensis ATCC 20868]EPE32005.1 MFS general substrate transporter [Glarea lozoyensis ATCC 20868]
MGVSDPYENNKKRSRNSSDSAPDERTPLLADGRSSGKKRALSDPESCTCQSSNGDSSSTTDTPKNITGVISILLLGVFIANADVSLVLATSGTISSEFDQLGNAGWLITSYTLAMCAAQSLYGKLSDIYGRKSTIIASYVFFAIGSAICGLGQTIIQVICGRLIAGVGGAGINCLVAIVIADMVPLRDVATWRSYVNIAATSGRSLGGPIGGFLTDTVGWRWSFLGQCPPTVIAMGLVIWKLQIPQIDQTSSVSHLSKLRRVDFLGAILLSISIVCGLMMLEMGGQRVIWTSPKILSLLGSSLIAGNLFILVEGFWAKEPIFPLRLLLNRDVVTSYINLAFQTGAQGAMMLLVPLYFQVSAHATVTNAGAHLMPSVIGNAAGGLVTGYVIKRTGRYKMISIIGATSAAISYSLMILRWHGHTNILESLYIIPGGFGNGVALSASFIALTAGVEHRQMAIASSGLYLSSNVGMVTGLSVAASILQSTLRKQLRIALEGKKNREDIINRALSDIEYVKGLHGKLGELVTKVYVDCLGYTHFVSLFGALVALIAAMLIREHRL